MEKNRLQKKQITQEQELWGMTAEEVQKDIEEMYKMPGMKNFVDGYRAEGWTDADIVDAYRRF